MITVIKIEGIPKGYEALPFGRQIEYAERIRDFKATAKTGHVQQKRQKSSKALRDFLGFYGATQWYARFEDSPQCRDDSYQIWYK